MTLLTTNTVHPVCLIAFLTLGFINICSCETPGYQCLATTFDICLDAVDSLNCAVATTVPDPENCRQYFICDGSSLYPATCADEKKFNMNLCECVPNVATCASSCSDQSYMRYIVTTPSPTTLSSTEVITSKPSTTSVTVPPVPSPTTTTMTAILTSTATSTTPRTSTTSTSTTTTTPVETTSTSTSTTSTSTTTTTPVPTTPSSTSSSTTPSVPTSTSTTSTSTTTTTPVPTTPSSTSSSTTPSVPTSTSTTSTSTTTTTPVPTTPSSTSSSTTPSVPTSTSTTSTSTTTTTPVPTTPSSTSSSTTPSVPTSTSTTSTSTTTTTPVPTTPSSTSSSTTSSIPTSTSTSTTSTSTTTTTPVPTTPSSATSSTPTTTSTPASTSTAPVSTSTTTAATSTTPSSTSSSTTTTTPIPTSTRTSQTSSVLTTTTTTTPLTTTTAAVPTSTSSPMTTVTSTPTPTTTIPSSTTTTTPTSTTTTGSSSTSTSTSTATTTDAHSTSFSSTSTTTVTITPLPTSVTTSPTSTSPTSTTSTTPTSTTTTTVTPSSSTTTSNFPTSTTIPIVSVPSSTTPLPISSSTMSTTLPTATRTVELTTSITPTIRTSSTPTNNATNTAVVTSEHHATSNIVAPNSIITTSTHSTTTSTPSPDPSTAVKSTTVQRAVSTSSDRSTVRLSTTSTYSTSPATSTFPVDRSTTISPSTSVTTFSRTSLSTATIPHITTISLPPANQATNATAAPLNVSLVTMSTTLPAILPQNLTTSAALGSSSTASSSPPAFNVSSISGIPSSSMPYVPDAACTPELPCHLGSRIADPGNCGKYFQCIQNPNDNRWMSQPCPGYKKFDFILLDCVDSSLATCHPVCNETIVHTVDMFPSVALEGAVLEFTCQFRYIFPQNQVEVQRFRWFLNGAKITPMLPGIIVSQTGPDDNGLWVSRLKFNPALPRYSGTTQCIVNFGNGRISAQSSIPYRVVALPSVTIDSMVSTVFVGNVFMLRCRQNIKSAVDESSSVVWLRDGTNITANNVTETITQPEPGLSTLSSRATRDVQYSCYCINRAGRSSPQSSYVYVIDRNSACCDVENVGFVNWTLTKADTTSLAPCPLSFVGTATRRCVLDSETATARWSNPDFSLCLHQDLAQLLIDVQSIAGGVGVDNSSAIEILAQSLYDIVAADQNMSLTNWQTSVLIVTLLADIHRNHTNTNVTTIETNAIVGTVGLLCSTNYASYLMNLNMSDGSSAVNLMRAVDIYSQALARQLAPSTRPMTLVGNGIVVQLYAEGNFESDTVAFPFYSEIKNVSWIDSSSDIMSINISATVNHQNLNRKRNAVSDVSRKPCYFSCAYYSTLHDFLPVQPGTNLGSRVLSMAIDSCLVPGQQLVSPVYMTFEHQEQPLNEDMRSRCVYWDYNIGGWSNESCRVITSNKTHTTCCCSHLTNFAVLFSPSPATGIHSLILSIISMIGCIISLVGLALTIIFFAVKWKQMKSHHAAVLINLCIALIIANIIFLAGSSQTKFPEWCKAAAVLLHYFFLAAFCLMLAEGIEMLLYIVFVFHVRRRRETAALIFAAWFIPLIIVAISMGVTRLDGYGGTVTCWLSVKTGLLWAFVAPALLIICLNFVILIIVICRISRIKARIDKMETKERMKTTLWNVLVILPILGITWIFGVVAVNKDLVAFQYIFAIANSLQGFFIFIFNTLCNKKASQAKASAKSRSKYSAQRTTTKANRSSELNRSTDDIIVIMANVPTPPQDRSENRRVSFAEDNTGFTEDHHTSSWVSSGSSTASSRSDSDMTSNITSATDLSNPNSHQGSTSHEPLRPILSGTSC